MLNRRTFAIISHPDAGKTTLTEKLLLNGGAIHIAGEVKARSSQRSARSDWMEMERKRGISITSSVMTFEYKDLTFNLLDTPGHQDFSEDTYRTLTAVDSAIMVIDAAKGIESQTLKLFEVCRLRDIPIITFINKMDREARDPFELLEEIEKKLALDVSPLYWPAGMGRNFRGCYDLTAQKFLPFQDQPLLEEEQQHLEDELTLLEAAGCPFDLKSYQEGHLTPIFFGSALRDFGIAGLLEALYHYAPAPSTQKATTRNIQPEEKKVSGFVFKVQANMDPNHRDRVAFVRLCSGTFRRGMKLKHVRAGKFFAIQNPVFFLAQERSLTEEAFPGDIVGIPNHGTLRIGDTLTEGEDMYFKGIPNFAPEIIRQVRLDDPLRTKHLRKALEDLAEEGVSQLFKPILGANWLVGVVGQLQFDVMQSRIESEYQIKAGFEAAPYETARWIFSDNPQKLKEFMERHRAHIAEDRDGRPVFLVKSAWDLRYAEDNWKDISFRKTCEHFG
jgi:peptide chain release factor 3